MILSVEKINKTIKGKMILSDVSLKLESGKVYGIVGRNGSGKTMLFRAIAGLMGIDSGVIKLDDKILHKDMPVLENTGIVLENAGLYPDMSGYKNLEMLAKLSGKAQKTEIVDAIKRVGLDPYNKLVYRKYSLGMKQRIMIAQAIMEKPDILMLDEPTNAIDEDGIEMIRKIIIEEKSRGAIVLLASHNKEDIDLLTDVRYHMKNGCLSQED